MRVAMNALPVCHGAAGIGHHAANVDDSLIAHGPEVEIVPLVGQGSESEPTSLSRLRAQWTGPLGAIRSCNTVLRGPNSRSFGCNAP